MPSVQSILEHRRLAAAEYRRLGRGAMSAVSPETSQGLLAFYNTEELIAEARLRQAWLEGWEMTAVSDVVGISEVGHLIQLMPDPYEDARPGTREALGLAHIEGSPSDDDIFRAYETLLLVEQGVSFNEAADVARHLGPVSRLETDRTPLASFFAGEAALRRIELWLTTVTELIDLGMRRSNAELLRLALRAMKHRDYIELALAADGELTVDNLRFLSQALAEIQAALDLTYLAAAVEADRSRRL